MAHDSSFERDDFFSYISQSESTMTCGGHIGCLIMKKWEDYIFEDQQYTSDVCGKCAVVQGNFGFIDLLSARILEL